MTDQSQQLLAKALDGAVVLDRQLNLLLDAYDFFTQRYPATTPSQDLELKDLQASIKALGSLPQMVALTLVAWRTFMEPPLSREGFEVNVLNEITIHMHSMARFFHMKHIDLEPYSQLIVRDCMTSLVLANKQFGKTPHEAQ